MIVKARKSTVLCRICDKLSYWFWRRTWLLLNISLDAPNPCPIAWGSPDVLNSRQGHPIIQTTPVVGLRHVRERFTCTVSSTC
jgi:hypothetical protein